MPGMCQALRSVHSPSADSGAKAVCQMQLLHRAIVKDGEVERIMVRTRWGCGIVGRHTRETRRLSCGC